MPSSNRALRRRSVLRRLLTGRLAVAAWVSAFVAIGLAVLTAQGTWVTETSLPSAIQEVSVTALNGMVYVIAGSVNQVRSNGARAFNASTHTWTSLANYPGTAVDHAGIATTGGFVYLFGGLSAWPSPSVSQAARYDPSSNTWTPIAPLPVARGAGGAAVINGKIYYAGGLEAGVDTADFTVYDPTANTWTTLPSMPTSRDHVMGAAINGKFYAIGGNNPNLSCGLKTVEVYDPSTNSWSTGPSLLVGRAAGAVGQANGHIQVFGGDGNAVNCGVLGDSEDFDPGTNTWSHIPDMPTPRHGTGGGTLGNSVYIPGGGLASNDLPTAVHERFDALAQTLPTGWADQDIGTVGLVGGASFANGVFTVEGEGSDIWGSADSFHFAYQSLSGDGQIVARLVGETNTNAYAKAGIMLRGALTAGAQDVILDAKPGSGGLEFMVRSTSGGSTLFNAGASTTLPVWLKLVRSGTTITGSYSSNGTTWTTIGSTSVSFPASVSAGLAVCSHSSGFLNTSTFDNVAVTPASGGTDNPPSVSITTPANGTSFTAGSNITIGASATDGDSTPVAKVDFYANNGTTNTLLGSDTSSPYAFTWSNVQAGSYTLTAVATDTANLAATSAPIAISVASGGGGGTLPSPWVDQDIGNTGLAGSATYNNGTFTVQAAGADIWGTSDSFNYLYQSFSGDGQIVARVDSLQNTSTTAKAGVMFRETINANSAHVLLDIKPDGGLEFMQRASTGASEAFLAGRAASFPAYLKLVRAGTTFTAYWSTDGNTWTTIGTTSVTMAMATYAGLAVCAHTTTSRTTAVFNTVSIVATGGGGTDNPPTVSITSPASGASFTAGSNISIAATASDGDSTPVARVAFYANNGTTNTLLGTDTTSPYTFSWTNVQAGSYMLTAVATDTASLATTSAPVSITVGSGGGGALPSPWIDADVGNVGLKGSATYNNGVFTVNGAGSDIWGTADSFNFVYQPLTGDGQITARVVGIANTNVYAKAGVQLRQSLSPSDASVTLDLNPNGGEPAGGGMELLARTSNGASTTLVQGAVAFTPTWVKLVRSGNTISGYASTDGNGWSLINSATISGLGSTVYVGLAVCSHTTSALNTSTFDHVSVATTATVPNPITFSTKVLAAATASGTAVGIANLTGPTVIVRGPDRRLYVSNVDGRIFVLTIDATKLTQSGQVAVTNVQEIDTIYNHASLTCNVNNQPFNCQPSTAKGRQLTGMTFDPSSTASNLILYVANSNFSTTTTSMAIDTYSGTITRLVLQPSGSGNTLNVVGNQDLVVGLPRSRESHATNGVRVGPDGWLYIAQGGNTNAGQPSSYFLNLPEYYLGASVLRLNLAALPQTLPIDMHNATASTLTPYKGVFEIYSTGYRNPYDLVWHSNGNLFININSPNQGQGLTPSSSDGCSSTPSIDVGTIADYLRLVTPGSYGGHPNPARGQCVWGDGSVYSPPQPTPSNYLPYVGNYKRGWGDSSDGITEYTSNAFGGAIQGNLITATFDDDLHVRRVALMPDGKHVNAIFEFRNTFTEPLSVCVDAAGNLYVADYGARQIVLMIAASPGQ